MISPTPVCIHYSVINPLHQTEPYPGLVVVVAGDVGDDLLVLLGEGDPGDGPGVGTAVAVVDGLGLHDDTVDLPAAQNYGQLSEADRLTSSC